MDDTSTKPLMQNLVNKLTYSGLTMIDISSNTLWTCNLQVINAYLNIGVWYYLSKNHQEGLMPSHNGYDDDDDDDG